MNISLVTGSEGFIGTNLVKTLEESNFVVRKMDNRCNFVYDCKKFKLVNDMSKAADVIFHLANNPNHRNSMRIPHSIIQNNYATTLNIAEASRVNDCKLVFYSSFSVYGKTSTPWKEYQALDPTTPYGFCKIQSEQLLEMYHKLYGVDVIIIRPSNVFGPFEYLHQPIQVIPTWLKNYANNEPLVVYGEDTCRDFTYVLDIVNATVKSIEKTGFRIYNLCSGYPTKLLDVAKEISDKVIVKKLPDHETTTWYGKNELAKEELGFKSTKTIMEWVNNRKERYRNDKS